MAINTQKIAQNHSVVTLVSQKYEGNRSIRKEEAAALLPGLDSDAINRKVVSMGTKKLYNPQLLNEAEKLKTRAVAAMERVGVKHTTRPGLNYIVANDVLDNLLIELEGIQADYYNWVNTQFSDSQYQADLLAWADENPEIRDIILAASPSAYSARNRFVFDLLVDDIAGAESESQSERIKQAKERTTSNLIGSLGERLIFEISQLAEKTLVKSVDGQSKLTRRVLSPAKTISTKLKALSMLTPVALPLAAHIDKQVEIASEGGSKPLTSAQVATIVAMYQMLAQPEQIERMFAASSVVGAEETDDEDSVEETLSDLLSQPTAPVGFQPEFGEELPEQELVLSDEPVDADMVEAVTETTPAADVAFSEEVVEPETQEVLPTAAPQEVEEFDISSLF
jgi:hypothetical protein